MRLTRPLDVLLCQILNFADEDGRFGESNMLVLYVSVLVDDEDRWRGLHGIQFVDVCFVSNRDPAHEVLISMVPQNAIGIARGIHADHHHNNIASEPRAELSEVGFFTNAGRAGGSHEFEHNYLSSLV